MAAVSRVRPVAGEPPAIYSAVTTVTPKSRTSKKSSIATKQLELAANLVVLWVIGANNVTTHAAIPASRMAMGDEIANF